jgi:hypothetical protein
MNSGIVAVSNGEAVLKCRLGSTIDAFDHVVRFNAPVVEGFEEFVGSKTTIWSRGRTVLDNPVFHHCRKLFSVRMTRRSETDIADDVEVIPTSIEREIRRRSGMAPSKWPTTGMSTLIYLLREFATIHTIGWLKEDTRDRVAAFIRHYFDPQTDKKAIAHDIDAECRLFDELKTAGRIVELD